jgi:hypothetical protein
MRLLTVLFLVAGCGGGDGAGDAGAGSMECAQLQQQLAGIASANRTCQADSDCHWLADGCLGECATFVNSDGLDAAHAVIAEAAAAGCNSGCQCLALKPACNRGACGPWMPSHGDGGI